MIRNVKTTTPAANDPHYNCVQLHRQLPGGFKSKRQMQQAIALFAGLTTTGRKA